MAPQPMQRATTRSRASAYEVVLGLPESVTKMRRDDRGGERFFVVVRRARANAAAAGAPKAALARHALQKKLDPWWPPGRSWARNVLRLPLRAYKQLFYYSRADTYHKQLRAPEWGKLYSQTRFLHALFVYLGVSCCCCFLCVCLRVGPMTR